MTHVRRVVSVSTAAVLTGSAIWANVVFGACAPPTPRRIEAIPGQVRVVISAEGVTRGPYAGPPARFEFSNQDSVTHEILSDPHPGHDRCPELNLGALLPRASRFVNFNVRGRICGFHDETRPDDPRFRGSIVIR